ncbi:hypothetical protein NUU61_006858 [Penicillium alfredii]|uniref:NAD(P)-binding domain-containing protein n=1 Tax=Penicillium alfredii TaxID=1506179 RepID=A0A9W9F1L0_9EURO|nr:uncharacterized protein NUU61_006858 [Penicillium alfredii]KAJ5091988.1 hypothetical protein NUU61_006858 [Penicillium alfredii]
MQTTTAFLGATGGCVNSCLAHSLQNGFYAVALARTPSKLTSMLLSQGLVKETLDRQLRIIQGDATDPAAIKATLLNTTTTSDGTPELVSSIISGIGGLPTVRKMRIEFDHPHICEETTQALLTALREIYAEYPSLPETQSKPLLTVISGMGIEPNNRDDVPWLIRWPFHALLHIPHADKWRMEEILAEKEPRSLFTGVVVVRPGSLLTGDHTIKSGKGLETVRVGTGSGTPVVGYTISRADVGEWVFREIMVEGGQKWIDEKVSLTN